MCDNKHDTDNRHLTPDDPGSVGILQSPTLRSDNTPYEDVETIRRPTDIDIGMSQSSMQYENIDNVHLNVGSEYTGLEDNHV